MGDEIEDVVVTPEQQVHTIAEVPQIKAASVSGIHPAHWRADLWADIRAALAFANEPPLAGPGAIVFDERANGQVRTFYLTGSQVWTTEGQSFGDQTFRAHSQYQMA
jgi:hypothetical protein